MIICLIVVICTTTLGIANSSNIPSYIHICKRNDPEVENCVRESVDLLRPYLKDGIAELDVPGLEPLHIPVMEISPEDDSAHFKFVLRDIDAYGASDFQLTSLKLDIPKISFGIGVKIPLLRLHGMYDVNARVVVVQVKGEGEFRANATSCVGSGVLEGVLIDANGEKRLNFTRLDLKLKIGDYKIHLDNLFNGDAVLSKTTNSVLNQNRHEFIDAATPYVQRAVSEILIDIANKVVQNFSYDEIFPEK